MSKTTITFKCSRCGSTQFRIPSNPKPTDMIKCASCGIQSRYEDVRKEAMRKAKAAVEKELKNVFRK